MCLQLRSQPKRGNKAQSSQTPRMPQRATGITSLHTALCHMQGRVLERKAELPEGSDL